MPDDTVCVIFVVVGHGLQVLLFPACAEMGDVALKSNALMVSGSETVDESILY